MIMPQPTLQRTRSIDSLVQKRMLQAAAAKWGANASFNCSTAASLNSSLASISIHTTATTKDPQEEQRPRRRVKKTQSTGGLRRIPRTTSSSSSSRSRLAEEGPPDFDWTTQSLRVTTTTNNPSFQRSATTGTIPIQMQSPNAVWKSARRPTGRPTDAEARNAAARHELQRKLSISNKAA